MNGDRPSVWTFLAFLTVAVLGAITLFTAAETIGRALR